jgi:hypothetical protein
MTSNSHILRNQNCKRSCLWLRYINATGTGLNCHSFPTGLITAKGCIFTIADTLTHCYCLVETPLTTRPTAIDNHRLPEVQCPWFTYRTLNARMFDM